VNRPPPEIRLIRLATACHLSRAVQVAARIGIGDLLRTGPRSAGELAGATGTDRRALHRLLRFLAEIGVVEEVEDGVFAGTELSDRLEVVDNLVHGEEAWAVWGALPEALATGGPVFERVHGASFFDYAAGHPELAARWHRWNSAAGGPWFAAVAAALEIAGNETVVDVGGGEGGLLAELLRRHPGCRGVLLDFEVAVRGATALATSGVCDRTTRVAGDALESVPAGGDVFLLCRVLLNLGDRDALTLLRNCRRALGPGGRLLVVEAPMPERGDPRRRQLAAHDLDLLLLWGGAHRTRDELAELLAAAGLTLHRAASPPPIAASGWWVFEARVAG